MAKKNVENLMSLCNDVWNQVDNFCGNMEVLERASIFAAVRQRLNFYRRAESTEVVKIPAPIPPAENPTKEKCQEKFDPEKCSGDCKENSPEEYQKCLESFQAKVKKAAKAKPTEEKPGKGRSFDKDFWGFDKKAVTGKINEIISKKLTSKPDIAETLGIDSQRVAVHLSNLKKAGYVLKKKRNDEGKILYKLTKEKTDTAD